MPQKDIAIVSCGTLRRDLEALEAQGELEGCRLFFTDICLKERPKELERQLKEQVAEAGVSADSILVIYGTGCFSDSSDFSRSIDTILEDTGVSFRRIKEHSCVEMMATEEQKESWSSGQKVYWLMPAWIEDREEVFQQWDVGKRNETFPQNDVALVLDSRGFFAALMEEDPEAILDFSDWMGLALDAREIDRERLKSLISACLEQLRQADEL